MLRRSSVDASPAVPGLTSWDPRSLPLPDCIGAPMAVSRYCPHGKLRSTCSQCKLDVVEEAEQRAAANRARGESNTMGRIEDVDLPYPWQRESMEAWTDGGRAGLVALSLGLPLGDLPYAVAADVVNANPTTNVLIACDPAES